MLPDGIVSDYLYSKLFLSLYIIFKGEMCLFLLKQTLQNILFNLILGDSWSGEFYLIQL